MKFRIIHKAGKYVVHKRSFLGIWFNCFSDIDGDGAEFSRFSDAEEALKKYFHPTTIVAVI